MNYQTPADTTSSAAHLRSLPSQSSRDYCPTHDASQAATAESAAQALRRAYTAGKFQPERPHEMDKKPANASLTHDIRLSKRGSTSGIKFDNLFDSQAFKRWLGRLNMRRAYLRTPTIPLNPSKRLTIVDRLIASTFPWKIEQYPGADKMLAWLLGVKMQTAVNYRVMGYLPADSGDRAAAWCRAKASELIGLAVEMERDAAERRLAYKPKPAHFRAEASARARYEDAAAASAKGVAARRANIVARQLAQSVSAGLHDGSTD